MVKNTTILHGLDFEYDRLMDKMHCPSSLLANSRVERCRTDDLMPNVPISCLSPSLVDPED